jgi:hypothetical protein
MRSSPRTLGLKAPIALTVHPVPPPADSVARAGTIQPRRRALATVYETAFRQLTCLISGEALRGPALLGIAGSAVVMLWRRMQGGVIGADFAGGDTEPNRVEQHALQNGSASIPVACAKVHFPEAKPYQPGKEPEQITQKAQHAKVS